MQIILEKVTIIYELYEKSKEEAIFNLFYKVSKFLQEWKKKYTTILNSLKKRAKQIQKKKQTNRKTAS